MEQRVVRHVLEGRTLSDEEQRRLEVYAIKRRGLAKEAQERKHERVRHAISMLKKLKAK
ncbi:hypothetical protein [Paraburkholderia sp. RL17-337-BIB-A]|uniref:hypothetical protein n=1 Tax=Paraburkholderia sp. RL17-337-BIB-A TaxID=3031636 RepID=UPI0038BA6B84